MRLLKAFLFVAAVGLTASNARADVKPHPLFTDNMVLQQGVEVPVWGKAEPGEKVTVEFGRATAPAPVTAEAMAGDDGKWSVKLPKQAAGVGYTLTIKGKGSPVVL